MTVVDFDQTARHLHLGDIRQPLLVFGGPYSNLEATEAVLAIVRERGLPMDRVICTGDVVAYCADPQPTVDAMRRAGMHVVMGNCEESLGQTADDCGCGFEEGSACDVASRHWFSYATAEITDDARRWMRDLPRRIDFEMSGRRVAVVHGSMREISRFVFASTPAAEKLAEIRAAGTDAVVGGHCGLPFTQVIEGRLWHNAGVIGMPANDGTPRAWYSLLEPGDDGIRISHHAFAYDHATASAKMRVRGLPAGYADALTTGLWPSQDVLPTAERLETGTPIEPADALWRRTIQSAVAS